MRKKPFYRSGAKVLFAIRDRRDFSFINAPRHRAVTRSRSIFRESLRLSHSSEIFFSFFRKNNRCTRYTYSTYPVHTYTYSQAFLTTFKFGDLCAGTYLYNNVHFYKNNKYTLIIISDGHPLARFRRKLQSLGRRNPHKIWEIK